MDRAMIGGEEHFAWRNTAGYVKKAKSTTASASAEKKYEKINGEMRTLISHVVAQGHGTIAAGNGTLVVYGPNEVRGPGIVYISNEIHGEEAGSLIQEALVMAPSMVKSPKTKRQEQDVAPTEE